MNPFKQILTQKFGAEESMGFYQENEQGQREEEFLESDPGKEFEGAITYLPNGDEAYICTNCAKHVINELGEGDLYGFLTEDNPQVTHHEIKSCDGHDFAVIKGRFIVDAWISHFTGAEDQVIYDLKDPKDQDKIKEIFGSPENWSYFDPVQKDWQKPQDIPQDKKITLGADRTRAASAPTMSI
jgi:hypothetical protein